MKRSHVARIARLETHAAEQRLQALRQTIADLEQRKLELLADLTTLEAAIAHMRLHVRSQRDRGQKEPPA